ncbi:MAG: hypothetical protein HY369_05790 [Candidatus Aenigmarchaeota archaeon]|nr:hypothetical protein [Candidatus Aenigmarchaeota archaeon]
MVAFYKIDKHWALFYGILIGDGCLSLCGKHRFVVITCNLLDDIPFFDSLVVPLAERLRGRRVTYRKRYDWNKIEINFSDPLLFESLVSLGFPIGKKGPIIIPVSFPQSLWRYIIAGIFATDGSFVLKNNNGTLYPRIEFRSISQKLLLQIKEFLIGSGMKGNVYRTVSSGSIAYRLEFPGVRNVMTFEDTIGFANPKHTHRFLLSTRYRGISWKEWLDVRRDELLDPVDNPQYFTCPSRRVSVKSR